VLNIGGKMILVKDITKIYKLNKKMRKELRTESKEKKAVDNLTFQVDKGEIYGLLGPNGAGKTTTLRIMSTLIKPNDGFILIDELKVSENPDKIREKISFLTNEIKIDEHFTGVQTLNFFGEMRKMNKEEIKKNIETLSNDLELGEFLEKRISTLSTGMKQRLSIAVALIHNPEVIIFDEPTNGLDIITARRVVELLKKMKNMGKTIVVSSHQMNVIETLCDRVGIIFNGKLVIEGTLEYILNKTQSKNLEDAFFKLYVEE
jgi:sodium transport system ATP-binding protein